MDDLRPELGIYGADWIHSPNIDGLATSNGSVVFDRMYTAVSVCGPARSAILTGRRADTTHCWSLGGAKEYWRDVLPNAFSLPQYFLANGYTTIGIGKIFHPGAISGDNDKNHSWSAQTFPYYDPGDAVNPPADAAGWWAANSTVDKLSDGLIAQRAVETLATLGNRRRESAIGALDAPFFLAVGLHKVLCVLYSQSTVRLPEPDVPSYTATYAGVLCVFVLRQVPASRADRPGHEPGPAGRRAASGRADVEGFQALGQVSDGAQRLHHQLQRMELQCVPAAGLDRSYNATCVLRVREPDG